MDLVVDSPLLLSYEYVFSFVTKAYKNDINMLQFSSLWGLFPLITFVVNMMYLQIIYQHEALQIPKMIKQKVLQLACKQMRYGFTKNFPYISYGV